MPLHLVRQAVRPGLLTIACVTACGIAHFAPLSPFTKPTYQHLAFSVVLAGAAAGLVIAGGNSWFLAQLPPGARGRAQALPLLIWALAPAGALSAGGFSGPALSPSSSSAWFGLLVSALHVAGIAFLLLRSPLPTRLLPLALVALAWWIPALIPAVTGLLDASPTLAPDMDDLETCRRLVPTGALYLAATLLPPSRGTKQ